MPSIIRNKFKEDVTNFIGGQYSATVTHSSDDPAGIGPNQVTLLQNCVIDNQGHAKQRLGLTSFDGGEAAAGISDARVYGLGVLDYSSTNKLFRMINDGSHNEVQVLDPTLDGWSNVLINTLTSQGQSEMFQAGSRLVVLNDGNNNAYSIDTSETTYDLGSTASSGHPPQGVTGCYAGGRVWLTDSNGDVFYSDALPTLAAGANEWNQTDQSLVPRSPCEQLLPFKKNEVVVYGRNSIELVNIAEAQNLWRLEDINEGIGLAARRTAQNIFNDQVFLARDGFRLLSRTQFDTLRQGVISNSIQDVVDGINWNTIDTAWSVIIDNQYVCGIPCDGSAYANMVVVLNLFWFSQTGKPAWTVHGIDDWNLYSATIFKVSGDPTMVGGTAITTGDRDVFKCYNGNTDDGTAIAWNVKGREHKGGSDDEDKVWSHVHLDMAAGEFDADVDVRYEVDAGGFQATDPSSLNVLGGATLPADDLYPAEDLYPGGSDKASGVFWIKDRGVTCRPSFSNTTSSTQVVLFGYEVYGQKRNVKGG